VRPRRLATRWVYGSVAVGSSMMVLWMSGFCGCVGLLVLDEFKVEGFVVG
jgi:hypothetical protein